ncbi:hypothetical protein GCM10027046_20140 [Uliginosibacterium flavum]|uniref:Uncharacterized protein n=1 Tax=Uliginosibacterium flavum TaxID=1396831 RepID=A0ABV2TI08_9RHOO
MKIHVAIVSLFFPLACFGAEMYRAPSSGDSGAYYILKQETIGAEMFKVLSNRVGKGAAYTDFTELKVNCKSKQFFELAGGEADGKQMTPPPELTLRKNSKWVHLVPGSSKSDLVKFVCSKKK